MSLLLLVNIINDRKLFYRLISNTRQKALFSDELPPTNINLLRAEIFSIRTTLITC